MKHHLQLVFVLLVSCLLGSQSASAAGPKEFFMNSAGLEMFGGANRISLTPGFNFGLFPWMQVGGSFGYQSVGFADDSVNTTTIQIGPTFNLDGSAYASATFLFFGYAIRKGSGTVSDTANDPGGSGLALIVGRRIPVMGNLAYRPSVGLQMAGKTTFVVNVLAASYFF